MTAPFDISLPAISRYLKVLEGAGLISREVEAQKASLPFARRARGWCFATPNSVVRKRANITLMGGMAALTASLPIWLHRSWRIPRKPGRNAAG